MPHKIFRKLRLGCMGSIGIALSLVLLYFLAALVLGSIPVNRSYAQAQQDGIEIFVTSNGVHTDIIVPVKTDHIDWRHYLPLEDYAAADSSYGYVGFGWGDRRFYMETPTWKDLTPQVAITASFWPTRTAMHVEYIRNRLVPNDYQRPILITAEQYEELSDYIINSFQKKNGHFILIEGAGYEDNDNFYEAHGKFYILKNCNNWVNQGLRRIGVRTAVWAPLPFAIMRHLR